MDRNGGKLPTPKQEWLSHIEETKLNARKQKIQRAINEHRLRDANPIAGYNLSAHRKNQKRKIKSCWWCAKKGHTRKSCPSMKLSQIQRLIWEMREKKEKLEKAQSRKKVAKIQQKHEAKIQKKKKKKHLEIIQAMNKALQLKLLINKDLDLGIVQGTPKYITEAMEIHQKLDPKKRILVEREYKKLFTV